MIVRAIHGNFPLNILVHIDNLRVGSDPGTIARLPPHMVALANTINHGEYEVETRGMPFETDPRQAFAAPLSRLSLFLLPLYTPLYPSIPVPPSLACTPPLIDDPAVVVAPPVLRWPVTLGKLRTPLIKLLFPSSSSSPFLPSQFTFSPPYPGFIPLERASWTRAED